MRGFPSALAVCFCLLLTLHDIYSPHLPAQGQTTIISEQGAKVAHEFSANECFMKMGGRKQEVFTLTLRERGLSRLVSALTWSLSFYTLICPSLCSLQEVPVSALHLVALSLHPNKPLPLQPSSIGCPSPSFLHLDLLSPHKPSCSNVCPCATGSHASNLTAVAFSATLAGSMPAVSPVMEGAAL